MSRTYQYFPARTTSRLLAYSCRNARMGSIFAARRAGIQLAAIATSTSKSRPCKRQRIARRNSQRAMNPFSMVVCKIQIGHNKSETTIDGLSDP